MRNENIEVCLRERETQGPGGGFGVRKEREGLVCEGTGGGWKRP
jgi:hypothetical protein